MFPVSLRSLERVISKQTIPLATATDLSDATATEQAYVSKVVAEADDPDYWYHASRDGNRQNHYQGSALGVTLVHDLSCFGHGLQQSGSSNGAKTASSSSNASVSAAAAYDQGWSTALPGGGGACDNDVPYIQRTVCEFHKLSHTCNMQVAQADLLFEVMCINLGLHSFPD